MNIRHAFKRKCSNFGFPLHSVLLLNSCPPNMELLNVNPIFNVSLNVSYVADINSLPAQIHVWLLGLMHLNSLASLPSFSLETTENITETFKYDLHATSQSSSTSWRWQNPSSRTPSWNRPWMYATEIQELCCQSVLLRYNFRYF